MLYISSLLCQSKVLQLFDIIVQSKERSYSSIIILEQTLVQHCNHVLEGSSLYLSLSGESMIIFSSCSHIILLIIGWKLTFESNHWYFTLNSLSLFIQDISWNNPSAHSLANCLKFKRDRYTAGLWIIRLTYSSQILMFLFSSDYELV